jgi:hypothetical protein
VLASDSGLARSAQPRGLTALVHAGYICRPQERHSRVPQFKEREMADNGQMIIELDRKRMTAMAQNDVESLRKMLCKGLVYTHSSARQDTKDSLLQGMESGSTVYTSIVPSDVKAQDLGNAVVLTGVAAISVNSNGKPNSFRVRFTDVYENQNGTWRMIAWQSTKIPE